MSNQCQLVPSHDLETNGLTLIDGILSLLCQGVPGEQGIMCSEFNKFAKQSSLVRSLCEPHKVPTPGPMDIGPYQHTVRPAVVIDKKSSAGSWKLIGVSAVDALYLARAAFEDINDACPKFILLPIEDQLSLYTAARHWPADLFMKYGKYFTAYPLARYLCNPLPVAPEGYLLYSGNPLVFKRKARRVLKNRLISHSHRNDVLWNGFLQGVKRGCNVIHDGTVVGSYVSHRSTLMRPPPATEAGYLISFERYVESMFDTVPLPLSTTDRLYEASGSASWERSRSKGGARAHIRDEGRCGLPGINGKCPIENDSNELIRMVETRPGVVVSVYGHPCPSFSEAIFEAQKEDTSVMVTANLEPLKVRMITKGPSYRMWTSKYMQKLLWNYLQKFKCFVLTGKELDGSDLVWLDNESTRRFPSFEKWVSGDYSAATDGLNIHCTKIILESVIRRMCIGDREAETLRSVLYEQDLHYPCGSGVPPGRQQNGQLMGSILSFPVLCLINMITYWMAIEEYLGVATELKDLPTLVNGDDILFKTNDEFYEVWKSFVGKAGFTLSLGKNYIHKQYLTINSLLFKKSCNGFRHIPYLNTGLLTGQSKVTGRDTVKTLPIWDIHNYCVPDAFDPERATKRFFHYNRRVIEEQTERGNYNCYLPPQRGGLGFIPCKKDFTITSFQRRLATLIEKRSDAAIAEGKFPQIALGLIRETKQANVPVFWDGRKLKKVCPVGPLDEGEELFEDRLMTVPPLCLPIVESALKFRPVRNLGELRKNCVNRMGDEELWSTYRVARVSC